MHRAPDGTPEERGSGAQRKHLCLNRLIYTLPLRFLIILMREEYREAAEYIKERLGELPRVAVLTGTGLGLNQNGSPDAPFLRYRGIPNFPIVSAQGHRGELSIQDNDGAPYVLFSGRLHYYEGHNINSCGFPIHVMHSLGITDVIMTNVSGSVNEKMRTGDFVMIRDHMNLMGVNPLRGLRDQNQQLRFPEMITVHATHRHGSLSDFASKNNLKVHEGVYAAFGGPSLETPAEYKMVSLIGGDVIGMSTVPEVICAAYHSMKVNVISLISNECFGERPEPATIESVLSVADSKREEIYSLVNHTAKIIYEERGY